MFWKKQVVKKEDFGEELDVNNLDLSSWLRGAGGNQLLNWFENLKRNRILCLLDKTDLTNAELEFRKGEISALKMVGALIKEIRLVKEEVEETEE